MARTVLTGQADRRQRDKNNFVFMLIIEFIVSLILSLVLFYMFGGGSSDDISPLGIGKMIAFIKSPVFDWNKCRLGPIIGFLVWIISGCYSYMEYERKRNSRIDEEYGSSSFLTARELPNFKKLFYYEPGIVQKYFPKVKTYYDNLQLKKVCKSIPGGLFKASKIKKMEKELFLNSQVMGNDIYLSMNCKFINRNLNTLTIGGSGQGKSYSELFPNALMGTCNYIFTDPSGEILSKIGKFLEEKRGYKIKIFNVDEMRKSMKYNPLAYIETEADYNHVVDALNKNIKPRKEAGASVNEFFDDAKDALMCALIALLKELYPNEPGKQTLKNVMRLLLMAEQEQQEGGGTTSKLDELFAKLREHDPRSYAAAQYKSFKVGGPKVCNEVIISATAVFSRFFNTDDLEWLTCRDELHLEELATEQPCALFLVTPAANTTYNFLASMIYSQIFELVTKMGKNYAEERGQDNPALPRHLSLWLDEFANIGKIPQFLELLSVVRKYNISINIIVQTLTQLKGMYKDSWETVVGNCDTMIYLGGQEPTTIKQLSEKLGKETIKTHNYSLSRGGGESYQNTGRNLLTPNEIEQMARAHELVFITGCKPIQTTKYNLKLHPNYKYSGEANTKNNYNASKFAEGNDIDFDYLDENAVTEEEANTFDFTKLEVKKGHKQGVVVSNKWRKFPQVDLIKICKLYEIPVESTEKEASYYGRLLDVYDREHGTEKDPVPVKDKKTGEYTIVKRTTDSPEVNDSREMAAMGKETLSKEEIENIERRRAEYKSGEFVNRDLEQIFTQEIVKMFTASNVSGHVPEHEFIDDKVDFAIDKVDLD